MVVGSDPCDQISVASRFWAILPLSRSPRALRGGSCILSGLVSVIIPEPLRHHALPRKAIFPEAQRSLPGKQNATINPNRDNKGARGAGYEVKWLVICIRLK